MTVKPNMTIMFGVCYNRSSVRKLKLTHVPDVDPLEKRLGYTFRDRSLLEQAITHRSWAHENVGARGEGKARRLHNEALEFVGDSVLGLVVAAYLFESCPDLTEGEMSRMKHRLVSAQTLVEAAERLSISQFLRVGRGEEKTGGRHKSALLADAFEAVLAAIFLDGGFAAATTFVRQALDAELAAASPEAAAAADYKTMLQETLQAKRQAAPQYTVVAILGPPHSRIFHVEANWNGGSVRGEGRSIKAAEMEAARCALEQMVLSKAEAAI